MDKWIKQELRQHYEMMSALFKEHGKEPFDLAELAYNDDQYSELDDGVYNYLPYLKQVTIVNGAEKLSLSEVVVILNAMNKDEDEWSEQEYEAYSKYTGKTFRLKGGAVYADTVDTLYQFTEKPTLKKTFQNWE